jgi:hypothetical protein
VAGALALLDRVLDYLNTADPASLPTAVQAECLRALERARAKHTAAQARVLGAFAAGGGFEDDGHGSARTWLAWQARVTAGAAAGAVGWARRLAAHRVIAQALAAGEVSESWARQLCAWVDRLPEASRGDAGEILVAAARAGVDLGGLAGLAREMFERTHRGADQDPDGGFGDRYLRLGVTFGGAGRVDGDLTPGCAAALSAVLDALGKKAGPEDTRTSGQRRHDALEEACRRLIASGMLPGRGGQPTQVIVHMSLAELRGRGSPVEAAWAQARATQPGWVSGPDAEAAACDATLVPVVTGHVDHAALDRLTGVSLATSGAEDGGTSPVGDLTAGAGCGPARPPLSLAARARLRRALLALAADVLSGPGGLAAQLRTTLGHGPLAAVSLPLEAGAATETIPAHLRRAVTTRHRHCAFPGCAQPASVCEVHHLIPRSRGGPTALPNLVPLCGFHHLTVIHRWGWVLRLHADGTTTATSPDRTRTLHSHGPPSQAA